MEKIVVRAEVERPVNRVWSAYTEPESIRQWNFASDDWHCPASEVDLRPGGRFSSRMESKDGAYGFDFYGEYLEVVPLERLSYRMEDREAEVSFVDLGERTEVTVTFDPESTHPVEMQRDGWQAILDNFKRYCERG